MSELLYGPPDLIAHPLIIVRARRHAKLVDGVYRYAVDGAECQCAGYEQELLGYEKDKLLVLLKRTYDTHTCGVCKKVYFIDIY